MCTRCEINFFIFNAHRRSSRFAADFRFHHPRSTPKKANIFISLFDSLRFSFCVFAPSIIIRFLFYARHLCTNKNIILGSGRGKSEMQQQNFHKNHHDSFNLKTLLRTYESILFSLAPLRLGGALRSLAFVKQIFPSRFFSPRTILAL